MSSVYRCGMGTCQSLGPSPWKRRQSPFRTAASTYRSSDGAGRSGKSRRSLGSLQKSVHTKKVGNGKKRQKQRPQRSATMFRAERAASHPPRATVPPAQGLPERPLHLRCCPPHAELMPSPAWWSQDSHATLLDFEEQGTACCL